MRLKNLIITAVVFTTAGLAGAQEPVSQEAGQRQQTQPPTGPERWELAMQAFEKADAENPPPQNAILFAGSSSIRRWDLAKFFPGRNTINRGFGGSQTSDLVHFVDRIVTNYEPRVVVVYEGDNDIASGKSPQEVYDDFITLCDRIHARVPDAPILFIAIKPSIQRWALWPKIQEANGLVETHAAGTPLVRYVDIAPATLGENGEPDPVLFAEDGLHLSDAGNSAWAEVLNPFLDAALADTRRN